MNTVSSKARETKIFYTEKESVSISACYRHTRIGHFLSLGHDSASEFVTAS